jgi:phenylacetate-CoA ligase
MKRAWSRRNLWSSAPAPVKSAMGSVIGHLPPAWLLGRRFRDNLAFVREAQNWSRDRSLAYQVDRLRSVLQLAYERTTYYRQAFVAVGFHPSDFRSPDDLRGLPTIDKRTLRRSLPEMCTVRPTARHVDYVSTGGTGGEPLSFYTGSGRSAIEYAYLVASWERIGYQPTAPMAVFRGRLVPPGSDGLRHQYDPLLRHHYYSAFHMSDLDMRRYVEHVRSIGPCFLHLYPSAGVTLVQFMRRSGLPPLTNVRGIIAESENVYPEQRALLEQAFRTRFFSSYGHSEKLVLAAECEHTPHYHVWPTYGFCELLDDQGRWVCNPGERGEIVGTGWINQVVPFIRYRTGDYATYEGFGCGACGREHLLLRSVEGRWPSGDLLAADGSRISMTALNLHDDTFARVLRFQFFQDTAGIACLRIVPAEGFDASDEAKIRASLGRRLASRLTFTIERVDEVRVSPAGKVLYVDQRIPGATADDH